MLPMLLSYEVVDAVAGQRDIRRVRVHFTVLVEGPPDVSTIKTAHSVSTIDFFLDKSVVNEMVVNAGDVPVYEVVVELQHTELGVLVYEEPDVMRQVVGHARLAGRHLIDVPTSVQYRTLRWRSMLVTVLPYAELPSSFIVSAIIALSGSASPSRRAADTDSPNCWKHGFRSYSTIWYMLSTTMPCARYHCSSGVASRIFSPW